MHLQRYFGTRIRLIPSAFIYTLFFKDWDLQPIPGVN